MKYAQGSTFSTIVDYGKSVWAYTDDSASYEIIPENTSAGTATGTIDRTDGTVKFGPFYKPTVVKITATSGELDVRNYEFSVTPQTDNEFNEMMTATNGMTPEEIGQALQDCGTDTTTQNMAVREWVSRTSAADNDWQGIAYSDSLGLFVAVSTTGSNDQVMTSPDGLTWTTRTPADSRSWHKVVWSPELEIFVATSSGYLSTSMYSDDGINWSMGSGGYSNSVGDLIWVSELSLFVTSGDGGTFGLSPDGINWTTVDPGYDINTRGIAYGGGVLSAVGNSGSGEQAIYSTDGGQTWSVGTGQGNRLWNGLAYSDRLGLFVAIAINEGPGCVMTSPDGINWTSNADNLTGIAFRDIAWSESLGLFCVVGSGGGGSTNRRVITSPDGLTLDVRYTPVDNQWWSVCWAERLGMFCAVSKSGTGDRVMTSR